MSISVKSQVLTIASACALTLGVSTANVVDSDKINKNLVTKSNIAQQLAQQNLRFEKNLGQTNEVVNYLAKAKNYQLFLTAQGAIWQLKQGTLGMQILDSNEHAVASGEQILPGVSNYFVNGKSVTDIPGFAKVVYDEIYPNIDIAYYSKEGQLEYDFIVNPGASHDAISIEFSGADSIRINDDGILELSVQGETIRWSKPISYQLIDDNKVFIESSYALNDNGHVGFTIGSYDSQQPLVIDPVLTLEAATYVGGSNFDIANDIAISNDGNYIYITGWSSSIDFPCTEEGIGGCLDGDDAPVIAVDGDPDNNDDVFVAKLDTSLNLIAATYIGGDARDIAIGIALSNNGDVFIAGESNSTNFPCSEEGPGGCADGDSPPVVAVTGDPGDNSSDAIVAKLDSNLNLLAATYFGGNIADSAKSIALANNGDIYIAGKSSSTDLPMAVNAPPADGFLPDAFIAKFDSSLTLLASAYLGGTKSDEATDIALAGNGDVFITGVTSSLDLPMPVDDDPDANFEDAFVGKFDSALTLLATTYVGGEGNDFARGIKLSGNNVYIAGYTFSNNFPCSDDTDNDCSNGDQGPVIAKDGDPGDGDRDAFVATLDSSSLMLLAATYVGGNNSDDGRDIIVVGDNLYITGETDSTDFPSTGMVIPINGDPGDAQSSDAIVAKLKSSDLTLEAATYIGGSTSDNAHAIAASNNKLYIAGNAASADFPCTDDTGGCGMSMGNPVNPVDGYPGDSSSNAIVAKLDLGSLITFNELIDKVNNADINKLLKFKLKFNLLFARCMLTEECIFNHSQNWVQANPERAQALGCRYLDRFTNKVDRFVPEPPKAEWLTDGDALTAMYCL